MNRDLTFSETFGDRWKFRDYQGMKAWVNTSEFHRRTQNNHFLKIKGYTLTEQTGNW